MSSRSVKRRFSRILLEVIEPVLEANRSFIRYEEAEGALLGLLENEPDSTNFFYIRKEYDHGTHGRMVEFECKPRSKNDANAGVGKTTLSQFKVELEAWCQEVRRLQERSILDDPILWGYEQEFYSDFKIADEDADTAPFNYHQQLLLESYVAGIKNELDEMRDERNGALIDELRAEADKVQQALTSETKNSVLKRITRWWAIARKGGLKYSNWMVGKFIEGLIKEGAGKAFQWASDNVHRLPYVIDHIKGLLP